MVSIRAVLFDLDGTLADTAPDLAAALNNVLAEEDREPLPYQKIRPLVSHGSTALIRLGFGLAPDDPCFAALRERLLAHYAENICRDTRVFPGVPELLDRLQARGMCWGIVTNKPAFLTNPLIERLGLAHPRRVSLAGIRRRIANRTRNRCCTPARWHAPNLPRRFISETPSGTSRRDARRE